MKYLQPFIIDSNKIRLGPEEDSGYVINEISLTKSEALFTYGVGPNYDYELDYVSNYNKPAYLFDPNIEQISKHKNVFFKKEGLGINKDQCKDFLTHYSELNLKGRVLLKIDIENNEWDWLYNTNISEIQKITTGLIIEFHDVKNQIDLLKNYIEEINKHFTLTHVHGNNNAFGFLIKNQFIPDILELSFVHNSLIKEKKENDVVYPTNLDFLNCPGCQPLDYSFIKVKNNKISKYKKSLLTESNTKKIIVGRREENEITINNPSPNTKNKYSYIPFKSYSDHFEITEVNDKIKIKRTDCSLGWGGNLIIEQTTSTGTFSKNKIPKIIHQTFKTQFASSRMIEATESWKNTSPNWEYYFYDDDDCLKIIKQNFSQNVVDAFLDLIPGAFKADLFRLCILYIKGGVYADADTISLVDLDYLIEEKLKFLISRDDPMAKKWLWNGFIASTKKNPILKLAIDKIVHNVKNKKDLFYLDYSGPALMGKVLNEHLNNSIEDDFKTGDIHGGEIKILHHNNGYIFNEKKEQILKCEYPDKSKDNISSYFWDNIQKNRVYRLIPRSVFYTSYDELDVNAYMINSFKEKNIDYDLKYFNQKQVDDWFKTTAHNKAYQKLTERGERTDFFRYCYLYEHGGIYTDADTFCNQSLNEWISYQDLIVGVEKEVKNNLVSVCNWTIAAAPKHPVLLKLITDISANPKEGVMQNTGAGRFTEHIINYFGFDHDFTKDIEKDNSQLLSINRFGSNQTHSNSIIQSNPFDSDNKNIYITHMFAGSWKGNDKRKSINLIPKEVKPSVSHNITISKDKNGYIGVARYDVDTARTEFMKKLGSSTSLLEYKFDKRFNVVSKEIKNIQGANQSYKFEDYREFKHKGTSYYCVAYLDKKFNTYMGVLDSEYNFLGRINIDRNHKMSFGIGGVVAWEKNWLFFEKENELYFIYSTTPNLIIYKCKDFNTLSFEVYSNTPNVYESALPKDQLYFSSNTSTGGSTNPIYDSQNNCYVYLIHTKIYKERGYNHFAVSLDKDLNIMNINPIPFIGYKIGYALMFITTMIENKDHYVICGGIEDNQNFIWEIPKSRLSI